MKKETFYLTLALVLLATVTYASYIELLPKGAASRLFGPIEVVECTDTNTVGTDCGDSYTMYGAIIEVDTGTITLPTATEGLWACVKSTTAVKINIDVQAGDIWILDGNALDAGDKISSLALIDDTVCFYADDPNSWTTVHNPDSFYDGG